MPCSLFWAMESCIVRVMAEGDLRAIGVKQSVASTEALQQQKQQLVMQMGEVYVVEHSRIVKAEPGAIEKLRKLM